MRKFKAMPALAALGTLAYLLGAPDGRNGRDFINSAQAAPEAPGKVMSSIEPRMAVAYHFFDALRPIYQQASEMFGREFPYPADARK